MVVHRYYKRSLPNQAITSKLSIMPTVNNTYLLVIICFTTLMISSCNAFIPQHLSFFKSSSIFDRNISRKVATLGIPPEVTKKAARRKKRTTSTVIAIEKLDTSEFSSPQKRRRAVLKRSKSIRVKSLSKNSSQSSSLLSSSTCKIKRSSTGTRSKMQRQKRKPRSSTMPGFREKRKSETAFYDAIDLIQSKSDNALPSSVIKKENEHAKKRSQDQMYMLSDSVPTSLMQFVEEIHKELRITPAEEVDLGTKTQEALRLQRLHDNLKNELKREPSDDEWCAAAGKFNMVALRQTIDEGIEAKNRLVTSNLRLVQRVVNLYIRNGLGSQYNAGDLMQEGVMALIHAAEKFEPQKGFRFSTYAMYWIRASVKRSQLLQSRNIYVPQRLHETFKKIQLREKELEVKLGYKPSMQELSNDLNLSIMQLERCIKAMKQQCFSLDAELTNGMQASSAGNNKKSTMYDLVENAIEDTEYKRLEQLFLREDLIESLRRYLNPLEVDLLLLRYGLMDDAAMDGIGNKNLGPKTINQVSEVVGLKPDKVRRLINNSLRQLKNVIEPEWQSELA